MNVVSSIASHAFDAALALVYPQPCAVCGQSVESRHDGVACGRCWNEAPLLTGDETLCWKCGALSLAKVSHDRRETVRCGRCETDEFTAARACGLYEGALRSSILELKRQPHVARRVAHLMYDVQQREPLNQAEMIIPVPLHHDRERERGFNQACVLARELSRLSGLPVDEYSVIRRIHTERHRAGMDAKARRQSVTNAFTVRHADSVSGKRVLLIDDVFTTGATVSACASVLKDAGAEEVFVLTVAKA
ncbi:MAG TPA: ComF family protein [Pyrinomonadaceae bacterium]|nr:ComF family protein [Pyrinomonadaceae bacterium]